MNRPGDRAWVEVDLDALVHNYRRVREEAAPAELCPVVKADAYGLGAGVCARLYEKLGARILAVSWVEEALELRAAGVEAGILVMAPFAPGEAGRIWEAGLTPAISSPDQLVALQAARGFHREPLPVHLKLETGLGRTGLEEKSLADALEVLEGSPGVFRVDGVFSHLAGVGQAAYAARQTERFGSLLDLLAERGISPERIHLAASPAILDRPQARFAMVRPGTLLYGQHPAGTRKRLELRDPFSVWARVVACREVPAGWGVGYGPDYLAQKPTRIAVLAVGWADGLGVGPRRAPRGVWRRAAACLRLLRGDGGPGSAWIGERECPFVGRPAMHMSTVRVEGTVREGEVARVPMMRLAASARLPRHYRYRGRPVTAAELEQMKEIGDE